MLIAVLLVGFLLSRPSPSGIGFCPVSDPWSPPQLVPNFLTPQECQYLMSYAKPLLKRSHVMGNQTNEIQTIRTSSQTWMSPSDPVAQQIYRRASALTGIPLSKMENLQIARYFPTQEYKAHHDACCANNKNCRETNKKLGLRNRTLLMYLNEDFTEGETEFPRYKCKITPKTGLGLLFHPLNKTETQCHPFALHGGLPVASGEKWIATIWCHLG